MKQFAIFYGITTIICGLVGVALVIELSLSLNEYCIYNTLGICELDYEGLTLLGVMIFTLVVAAILFLGLILWLLIQLTLMLKNKIKYK
ncbi:hypothetical protein MHO82_20425 [Vibrio sp. Of7-15]|uniref:hypothetical protein n=1 Tax=Vibrio sp. Of7-15 TaxID=2724879 RepID=UPI001EF318A6|nr:hypothetical protein [Vibrio sp. Of7-15]MCG7499236.1 hypothetical protein [Vibrio sp. Of7-15]